MSAEVAGELLAQGDGKAISNLKKDELKAATVLCINAPEPPAPETGDADPFIGGSKIRLSGYKQLLDRVKAIEAGTREAREAIEADHPLLNQLRTDRAEPSPTSPAAQSSSAASADSAEETATPPTTATALPSPEVLASMDASQADPALLAAMRRFLSQAEGRAGGQAAA